MKERGILRRMKQLIPAILAPIEIVYKIVHRRDNIVALVMRSDKTFHRTNFLLFRQSRKTRRARIRVLALRDAENQTL